MCTRITINTPHKKDIDLICAVCQNNTWYLDKEFKLLAPTSDSSYAYNSDVKYEENEHKIIKAECTECSNTLFFSYYANIDIIEKE